MKVLEGAFNDEQALIEAFSVIVKTDGSFAALKQIDGRLLVVWPAASVWRVTGIRQNWIRDTAARRQMTEPPLHRVTDITTRWQIWAE